MKHVSRKVTALALVAALIALAVTFATAGSARTGKKAASYQVCVLLPDTKSSVRWVQFDAPDFAKALKAAGVTYMISNALNDPQRQKAQAPWELFSVARGPRSALWLWMIRKR